MALLPGFSAEKIKIPSLRGKSPANGSPGLNLPQKSYGRGLIWVSALGLILFTVILAWLILAKIETKTRQDIHATLDTVLKTTQEALHNWVSKRMTEVTTWAFSPELLRIVKAQLKVPRTREALLTSPALADLRALLKPTIEREEFAGFFIITPDYISVASMRDANVGIINLLAEQENFLPMIFDGNVLISPLLGSDVPLPDATGKLADNQPTMFVAAPVRENGETLAVLTFRINPALHFNRITQLGRIGTTGETYAFDKRGRLITESRFDEQLRQIGLIPLNKPGILNIEIRDPGGNLLEGFHPSQSRQEQPLTQMAAAAIAGKPGVNVHGYRDYRGVPVAGAWLWNEDLGFGLTTEIDIDEAYQSLDTTRWALMVGLGLTVVLSLGFSITLDLGRRRAIVQAEKIQESKTHLKSILENLVEGIVTIDERGIIQTFNPAAEKIFGYRADEIIDQSVNVLMPEPYRSQHDEYIRKYLRTGQAKIIGFGREVSGLRKDGTTFPLDLAVSEMRLGSRRSFVGIIRDITEQKKAQVRLNQLSRAVEQSPASVMITDTRGNIEYVNPKFSQVTGYSFEEVKGKNPRIIKSGEMPAKFYKQLWETITAGKEWRGELHNKKKNGELFWELASISPIKNEEGVVKHYLAVKEDITQRKQTEMELKKEIMFKQLLKDVAVASNEALVMEDAARVCLDRVCELSGWPVGHLYVVGEDSNELIPTQIWHLDDPRRFATFIKVTEATGFSSGIGLPGRVMSSRKPAWIVDVNKDPNFPRAKLANNLGVKAGFGFPIMTGEKVVAVLEFFSTEVMEPDKALLEVMANIGTQLGRVSERKRAEERLKQSRQELRDLNNRLQSIREEERTWMAREIHDELGQMLTAIKIDLSWVEKRLGNDQKNILNRTCVMSELLDKTIKRVQKISTNLRPEVLDMLGLSEAIEWQAQEFQERTEIECHLDSELCDIDLNPDLSTAIFRILQETLTNVARHASASQINIRLYEKCGNLVLEVRDNGRGISKSQISNSKSLGLLGIRERALLWDGEVKISGIKGRGTTVIVKIPMDKSWKTI